MIPFKTYKTGISPCLKSMFNLKKLTGKQKLDLVRTRLFGTTIGGNMRSGLQYLRRNFTGKAKVEYMDFSDFKKELPGLENEEQDMWKKEAFMRRKMRIIGRGIKMNIKKNASFKEAFDIFSNKVKEAKGSDKKSTSSEKVEEKKQKQGEAIESRSET